MKLSFPSFSLLWQNAIKAVTAVTPAFLKAGIRYGDAAPMAIVELVDRDVNAKGAADKARVAAEKAAAEAAEKEAAAN